MNFEEKAHEVLDQWHERIMTSSIHQRIAAKINEGMEKGVETKIDDLEQSAASEHADSIMLSVLGQAIGNYSVARNTLSRIQQRLEMLSASISGYPVSDDMAEYVSSRIHTIQIEEICNAFIEANKGEESF
jgi:hypothetical protein